MNKKMSKEKKQAKTDALLKNCYRKFLSCGIGNCKMTELADECDIGVATLYRYFTEKENIVIAVADYLWRMKIAEFTRIKDEAIAKGLNGYETFRKVVNYFTVIADEDPDFLNYMTSFYDYCKERSITKDSLKEYRNTLSNFIKVIDEIEEQGKADGTIRKDVRLSFIYFVISSATIGISNRIDLGLYPGPEKGKYNSKEQSKTAIDLVLNYVKA